MNILLSWSGGKDSAMTLYRLQQAGEHIVTALLTTITRDYDRISMHGVRRVLLEHQAAALGLPVYPVMISVGAGNAEYETQMEAALRHFQQEGVEAIAFGDLFLADLRDYRERNLSKIGMPALFPIWKTDTRQLAHSLIDLGFKAVITCVDTQVLDAAFAGREIDHAFLNDLPHGIDPCGENGEFHSFVYDGPNFSAPVGLSVGETVMRDDRFCYADLVPNDC